MVPAEHRSELPSTPKSLPNDADAGRALENALYVDYANRVIEAYTRSLKDALTLYLPRESVAKFHASRAHIRLVYGSNQSGKSTAAMVEFARIVRGRDPFKKQAAKNLITLTVGKDERHIGQVLWRKLWFPGAFEIIRDQHTGLWRSVRPDPEDPLHLDKYDLDHKAEWQPAPPLLPPDCFAKPIAWENKRENTPSVAEFKTGTMSWFHTAKGSPRAGVQIDLALLDEECDAQRWLPELFPRLVRRGGHLIWDYTPEEATKEAYELYLRSVNGDPDVAAFPLLVHDNPYYPDEVKARLYRDLASQGQEILAAKWYGKHIIGNRIVYHEFDESRNYVEPREIPADWMRVAAIDPGTSCAAAVFGAVPPTGDRLEIYAELIVRNSDASKFAREFRRITGNRAFEAYIIDKQAGQQRNPGRHNNVADHYAEAFKEAGVPQARRVSGGFVWGSNDVQARELSVKEMLADGTLKFHKGKTARTVGQVQTRLRDKNNPKRREKRSEHDACDCYDAKTEVLTDGGWKLFSDLSGVETMATVNLATDTIEYQAPIRLIAKHYAGDMVKIGGGRNQRLDMMVTPTHRMVVMRNRHTTNEIRAAETLATTDRIKTAAAHWVGREYDCPFPGVDIGDFAEFLGWYIAEGCVKKPRLPGHGYGTVMSQVKAEGCERLEYLFSRLPFKWFKIKSGYQSSSNKVLWNMLAPLGNKYTKRVPEWIKWATQPVIRRFLDGAVGGDGWKLSNGIECYATVSNGLANDIQELFIKTGRAVSLSRREPKPCLLNGRVSTNTVAQYHLVARITSQCSVVKRINNKGVLPIFSRVPYDGMVYCATVPNGTLIVRRNGRIAVCGNCLEYAVSYFDTGLYYRRSISQRLANLTGYGRRVIEAFEREQTTDDRSDTQAADVASSY